MLLTRSVRGQELWARHLTLREMAVYLASLGPSNLGSEVLEALVVTGMLQAATGRDGGRRNDYGINELSQTHLDEMDRSIDRRPTKQRYRKLGESFQSKSECPLGHPNSRIQPPYLFRVNPHSSFSGRLAVRRSPFTVPLIHGPNSMLR